MESPTELPEKSKKKLPIKVIATIIGVMLLITGIYFFVLKPVLEPGLRGKWDLNYLEHSDGRQTHYSGYAMFESNGDWTSDIGGLVVTGKWKDHGGGTVEITANGQTQTWTYSIQGNQLALKTGIGTYHYTRIF
jgi:hypothetical protein